MRAFLAAAILFAFVGGTLARQSKNDKPQDDKPPESKPQTTNTQGQFLVASRGISDPFFKESVVLMLPVRQGPLLVGVIINKPTKVLLRDIFSDSPGLEQSDAKAYFGGPVDAEVGARSAIFRSKTPPKDAVLVFGDVYVTFNPGEVLALAENPQQASTVRVVLGRAQWAPEQLEGEASLGAWHSEHASTDYIFGTLPDALWRILIDKAEPKPVARNNRPLYSGPQTSALFE